MAMRKSHYCAGFFVFLFTFLIYLYSLPTSIREEVASWRSDTPYPPAAAAISEENDAAELPNIYTEQPDGTLAEGFTPDLLDTSNASSSIQQLWANNWAKSYVLSRPLAEKIELSRPYGNPVASPNDKNPRRPSNNRVKNSDQDITDLQLAHASFMQYLEKMETGEEYFKGRGIVTLGGTEYFGPAIIGLHMLRATGSKLPVEVFVADRQEYETAICDDYLPKLNAKCIVIADILNAEETEAPLVTHYQLKSLAMLFSSFAEILYVDSDSIPLVNPDKELFSTEPFLSAGLVSWPDFWLATESPLFYTIAGRKFPQNMPRRSSESGQLLINKRTHIKTLLLAAYYNFYGPSHYYPLLSQGALGQGDKETFLAAAVVLGQSYYRVKTTVKSVNRHNNGIKISGMVQHHPVFDLQNEARPAFLHANTPKMNAGHLVDEGDLMAGKTHLRLWGPQKDHIKQFGKDLEKQVWQLLVKTGCELADKIQEWKSREQLCVRLTEHYDAVFA
jgi:alpha 1,2-mannosyltransferase